MEGDENASLRSVATYDVLIDNTIADGKHHSQAIRPSSYHYNSLLVAFLFLAAATVKLICSAPPRVETLHACR